MKRMLIIAALCMLLVATTGTTAVIAKQTDSTAQKGKSPIYQFDVSPRGKVTINTAFPNHKFLFVYVGKGFDSGKTYLLQFHRNSPPGGPPITGAAVIGSSVANPAGVVVIVGTIDDTLIQQQIVQNGGDFVIGQHVL